MKRALVRKFKDDAEIMIATESAAEGLNLQFCSILVNYDLPWNPQRVEQRIGRVHRYGQKNDVVIINFINKKNVADVRLYEILQHKFKLFDGVFGASDEILGTLSDGLDFEKAVASIFELCRTPEEINKAFNELQDRLGSKKDERIEEIKQLVLENLNPTTQEKFNILKKRVEDYLDRNQTIFWELTKSILKNHYPQYFINEASKTFGEFESQVFGGYSDINFGASFAYRLDYTKRDYHFLIPLQKKALKLQAQAYNPYSNFGREVLNKAINFECNKLHFKVSVSDKLPKGSIGLGKLSLCETQSPAPSKHLLATFINENGNELFYDASTFFDHISVTGEFKEMRFQEVLNLLHERKISDYVKSEKKKVDALLKYEIEKLNRWLADEKKAIRLKSEKDKNVIANLKRLFKAEKALKKKLEFDAKIKKLEKKVSDAEFNIFDAERELEKKCNRIAGTKKRSLKYSFRLQDIFEFSFEIV